MSRLSPVAFLVLVTLGACTGPDAADLVGDHRRVHAVFVFHGSEPVEVEVEDRLLVEEVADGRLRFSLSSTSVSGGKCQIEGIAGPGREGFEYRAAGNADCVLRIGRRDSEILVEDVRDGCRVAHCAERASIGRLSFRRPR